MSEIRDTEETLEQHRPESAGRRAPDLFLISHIRGLIGRLSGRRYNLDLESLSAEQIRELHRLLRDVESDTNGKINKMRREPWRRF